MSLSLSHSLRSQARRAQSSSPTAHIPWKQQTRNATLLRRPKRPYTFTQLVTLTDGSAYLQRTTSPLAVYRSTKDMRNSPMWNPSSQVFLNVEEDEAGKLRKFREKFGRSWDSQDAPETAGAVGLHDAYFWGVADRAQKKDEQNTENVDHLLDLISSAQASEPVKKLGTETIVRKNKKVHK